MRPRLSPPIAVTVLIALAGFLCGSTKAAAQLMPGPPPGWIGANNDGWEVGLDLSRAHSGHGAGYLRSISDAPRSSAFLGQYLKADRYRGKRVRWSAWVRQVDVRGLGGGLWLRVDGRVPMGASGNMLDRPLLGTSAWHQVSVVLDVPGDAIGIACGALLEGRGTLLVDDVSLDVVGPDVSATNRLTTPAAAYSDSAYSGVVALYRKSPSAPVNPDFESPYPGFSLHGLPGAAAPTQRIATTR